MRLSDTQLAQLNTSISVISAIGPALGPNGAIVAALASAAGTMLVQAHDAASDVSDQSLQNLFDQFDANKAVDAAARSAVAAEDRTGVVDVAPVVAPEVLAGAADAAVAADAAAKADAAAAAASPAGPASP